MIPYALAVRAPVRDRARDARAARDAARCGCITDEGLVGLGEAVPLALRGGADAGRDRARAAQGHAAPAARRPLRLRRRRADAGRGRRLHPRRRRPAAPGAGEGGDRDGALRPRRQGLGRPLWSLLGAERAEPVRCNATLVAGEPGRGRRRRRALGRARLRDLQAQARRRRRRRARCARCASALGPEARIRVDANGAWSVDEALGVLRMIEPLGDRARRAAGRRRCASMAEVTAGDLDPDRRRRERRRASRTRSAPTRDGACDLATVKLAKVGGIGEANGIAARAADLPLERARRPARDRRRRARGAGAAVRGRRRGARPRPRDPAAVLGDDRGRASATLDGDLLSLPDGPGLGVELDEDALERLHRHLASLRPWTRPTATPRSPRRWSRSWRAAACATRSSAPARARPRWRWRSGASRRSTTRVIVDERSAGFFALGAAQATGTPGRGRSAPPGPRPPTSTRPSARPTSRRCR